MGAFKGSGFDGFYEHRYEKEWEGVNKNRPRKPPRKRK